MVHCYFFQFNERSNIKIKLSKETKEKVDIYSYVYATLPRAPKSIREDCGCERSGDDYEEGIFFHPIDLSQLSMYMRTSHVATISSSY